MNSILLRKKTGRKDYQTVGDEQPTQTNQTREINMIKQRIQYTSPLDALIAVSKRLSASRGDVYWRLDTAMSASRGDVY